MGATDEYIGTDRLHQRQARTWRDDDKRDNWQDEMVPDLTPRIFFTGLPACRGLDLRVFYGRNTESARSICVDCPVRVECLQWALDNGDEYGVQGGVTAAHRAEYAGLGAIDMIAAADLAWATA